MHSRVLNTNYKVTNFFYMGPCLCICAVWTLFVIAWPTIYAFMLCILTSFWVLRTPKSRLNYFFSVVLTFFVHFKTFSVISRLKSSKKYKNEQKKCVFVYSSKLVHMQKLVNSLTGYTPPLS